MRKCATVLVLAAAMYAAGLTSYAEIISDVPSAVTDTTQSGQAPPTTTSSGSSSSGSGQSSSVTSVIAGGPGASQSGTTSTSTGDSAEEVAVSNAGETVIVDVPGSAPDLPSIKSLGSVSGTGVIIAAPSLITNTTAAEAGSKYASDARTKVELGFTVVSPNVDYNGFKVAEGSVQLSDGSWDSIGHDKYIRQPYFKLLREEGDWYVVAVNARRIGNYSTPDGSTITELWLKKSDCTAKNYIELNTSNAKRQAIVKYALGLLGKGYTYGGNGPDAFDCSGFVNHVMSTNGIKVARTSTEICSNGYEVGITGLRPGDVVGRSGHVGIYIGDGYFIHAAESATGVITDSIAIYNKSSAFTAYRNVAGD